MEVMKQLIVVPPAVAVLLRLRYLQELMPVRRLLPKPTVENLNERPEIAVRVRVIRHEVHVWRAAVAGGLMGRR